MTSDSTSADQTCDGLAYLAHNDLAAFGEVSRKLDDIEKLRAFRVGRNMEVRAAEVDADGVFPFHCCPVFKVSCPAMHNYKIINVTINLAGHHNAGKQLVLASSP